MKLRWAGAERTGNRESNVVVGEHPAEQVFQLALGCGVPSRSRSGKWPDHPDAASTPPRDTIDERLYVGQSEQPFPDPGIERRLDEPGGNCTEVDNGALGGCDRDAVRFAPVFVAQVERLVHGELANARSQRGMTTSIDSGR